MTHDPELHKRLLRIMTANTFAERYGFTQEDGWILLDMHLNVALKTANEMLRRATRAEDKAASLEEKTDIEQAYAVGKAAVELAIKGRNSVMPTIVR